MESLLPRRWRSGLCRPSVTRPTGSPSDWRKRKAVSRFSTGIPICRGASGTLPEDIRQDIGKYGIRNSHLIAIAPADTISLLASNVSSGIEPVFDFRYRRRVALNGREEYEAFEVEDYAYRLWWQQTQGQLPTCFVDARSLTPEPHLAMQASLQPFVDNAISKTINVPETYPFERFQSLYERAYHKCLKGCTLFRPTPLHEGGLLAEMPTEQEGASCCGTG